MTRPWSLLAFLAAVSAHALDFGPPLRVGDVTRNDFAPFLVGAVVPDGGSGSVAFGRMQKPGLTDVVAIPIDAAGTSHPEQAFTIATNVAAYSAVTAAKSASGYLVTFRDKAGDGFVVPLNSNLSIAAAPLVIPTDEPRALACSGNVCGAVAKDTLFVLDTAARVVARTAAPGASTIAATSEGFAVGAVLRVDFFDREGRATGTASLPGPNSGVPASLAPHALGVAAFWPGSSPQVIRGAVVRLDGSIAQIETVVDSAALDGAGAATAAISAAANANGESVLVWTTMPAVFCTCIPFGDLWLLRLSPSLQPSGRPTRVTGGSFGGPLTAAAGNAFLTAWSDYYPTTGSQSLLVPKSGDVPTSSAPLPPGPAAQRGAGIAASADRILALWGPVIRGSVKLQATRFDRSGGKLDANPIAVFGSDGGVATDGRDFMINNGISLVTVEGDDGTRWSAASEPILNRSIAWDGAGYVYPTYENGYAISRVTPDRVKLWSKGVFFTSPLSLAALPGRTIVAGLRGDGTVYAYAIVDTNGTQVTSRILDLSWAAPVGAYSNRGDQFLLLFQDGNRNGSLLRVGADGALLDPQPVPIGQLTTKTIVTALGDHWVVFAGGEAVEFPSLARTPLPEGETVVAAAPAPGGRAVVLTERAETVDGMSVKVVLVRELSDSGTMAPRRRAAR